MYPIKTNNLKVSSKYGKRVHPITKLYSMHYGIDLIGGTEIVAFDDGEIIKVVNKGAKGGIMCQVRIKHSNGYETAYYHVKSGSICVKKGDKVHKGDVIAIIGDTGNVTGKHLHFQIDKGSNSSAINPYDYIFKNKEFIKKENKVVISDNTYKVVKGDTLSKIAKKYKTTVKKLMSLNSDIKDKNKIYTGQIIKVK